MACIPCHKSSGNSSKSKYDVTLKGQRPSAIVMVAELKMVVCVACMHPVLKS